MKYYVDLGGREFDVELVLENGRIRAEIEHGSFQVDCAEVEAGHKYSLLVEGESFNVTVNPNGTNLDLIVGGHLYRARVLDEREKGALALEEGSGDTTRQVVLSVMPGIVRKVCVTEGDRVQAGVPLLILEAMKMENEICAERDGTVRKVHVSEGATVNSSDPLVTIE